MTGSATVYDFAIVGGGIAGASLAAELAPHASVLILEAEDVAGYHSTGRSAAFWSESYGGPGVQPLTTASGPWLRDPPAEYGGRSFLSPRGELFIATAEDLNLLDAFAAEFAELGVTLGRVDPHDYVAGLNPEWTEGVYEPSCADIDVAGLHAAYLAVAKRAGAVLVTGAELSGAARESGQWRVETRAGEFAASILINAAGAWADRVAELAGARPVGIAPYRRTMVQLASDPPAPADMPLVRDARDRFYVKPDAGGRLWLSPHDEVPTPACDAQPEELDVAVAVDRLERSVTWNVKIERTWAGLRSFAPDRLPVYGFAADAPGFFWFAGQGGFGIQTAPAAAALAAGLLLGTPPAPSVAHIDPARYAPGRFGDRTAA